MRHAGIFQSVVQPGIGELPLARVPGCAPQPGLSAPRVGQDTQQVLADFGFASDEIAQLLEAKAVLAG